MSVVTCSGIWYGFFLPEEEPKPSDHLPIYRVVGWDLNSVGESRAIACIDGGLHGTDFDFKVFCLANEPGNRSSSTYDKLKNACGVGGAGQTFSKYKQTES